MGKTGRHSDKSKRQLFSERNVYIKRCALIYFALCNDNTVVVLYDPFNYSKTDASAIVLHFSMQALEQFKYLFMVLLFKANALI